MMRFLCATAVLLSVSFVTVDAFSVIDSAACISKDSAVQSALFRASNIPVAREHSNVKPLITGLRHQIRHLAVLTTAALVWRGSLVPEAQAFGKAKEPPTAVTTHVGSKLIPAVGTIVVATGAGIVLGRPSNKKNNDDNEFDQVETSQVPRESAATVGKQLKKLHHDKQEAQRILERIQAQKEARKKVVDESKFRVKVQKETQKIFESIRVEREQKMKSLSMSSYPNYSLNPRTVSNGVKPAVTGAVSSTKPAASIPKPTASVVKAQTKSHEALSKPTTSLGGASTKKTPTNGRFLPVAKKPKTTPAVTTSTQISSTLPSVQAQQHLSPAKNDQANAPSTKPEEPVTYNFKIVNVRPTLKVNKETTVKQASSIKDRSKTTFKDTIAMLNETTAQDESEAANDKSMKLNVQPSEGHNSTSLGKSLTPLEKKFSTNDKDRKAQSSKSTETAEKAVMKVIKSETLISDKSEKDKVTSKQASTKTFGTKHPLNGPKTVDSAKSQTPLKDEKEKQPLRIMENVSDNKSSLLDPAMSSVGKTEEVNNKFANEAVPEKKSSTKSKVKTVIATCGTTEELKRESIAKAKEAIAFAKKDIQQRAQCNIVDSSEKAAKTSWTDLLAKNCTSSTVLSVAKIGGMFEPSKNVTKKVDNVIMFEKQGQSTKDSLPKAKGFAVTDNKVEQPEADAFKLGNTEKAQDAKAETDAKNLTSTMTEKRSEVTDYRPKVEKENFPELIVNRKPQVKILNGNSPSPLEEVTSLSNKESSPTRPVEAIEATRSRSSFTAVAMTPVADASPEMHLDESNALVEKADTLNEALLAMLDDFVMWSFNEIPKILAEGAIWIKSVSSKEE